MRFPRALAVQVAPAAVIRSEACPVPAARHRSSTYASTRVQISLGISRAPGTVRTPAAVFESRMRINPHGPPRKSSIHNSANSWARKPHQKARMIATLSALASAGRRCERRGTACSAS